MANRIIAHTPLLLTPCSVPYRFVLVEKTNDMYGKFGKIPKGGVEEYVVWSETFSEDDHTKSTGFHSGQYFTIRGDEKQQFKKAYDYWLGKAQAVNAYIYGEHNQDRFEVC